MTIKTRDFILRHFKLSDAKEYYESEIDALTKKMHTSFPKNFEEAKKEVSNKIKDYKKKPMVSEAFVIDIAGKYAGDVTLQYQNFDPKSNEGRVHITIHPDFRGKGLATNTLKEIMRYGFKKKKMKRIFAQCKAINKGVIRVNEKCGFKKVKTYVVDGGIKKILWVKER